MNAVHQNHRKRMIERFKKEGFFGFATHELLEMLFYFSQPRVDTNPCAHSLLENFGSLQNVMNASLERLCTVKGMGETSAILLKLVVELERRYLMENTKSDEVYDTLGKVADFLYPYFHGVDHECLYMMMLNNRMNLLDCVLISEGVVNSTTIQTSKISRLIWEKNASAVIFAHNHPSGLAIPSASDTEAGKQLNYFLGFLEVISVEHLIFAENRFCTLMKQQIGYCRPSPLSQKIDPDFYRNFYNLDEERYVIHPRFPGVT